MPPLYLAVVVKPDLLDIDELWLTVTVSHRVTVSGEREERGDRLTQKGWKAAKLLAVVF